MLMLLRDDLAGIAEQGRNGLVTGILEGLSFITQNES